MKSWRTLYHPFQCGWILFNSPRTWSTSFVISTAWSDCYDHEATTNQQKELWLRASKKRLTNEANPSRSNQSIALFWKTHWFHSNQISEIKALTAFDKRICDFGDKIGPVKMWEILLLMSCPKTQCRLKYENSFLSSICLNKDNQGTHAEGLHCLLNISGRCWEIGSENEVYVAKLRSN